MLLTNNSMVRSVPEQGSFSILDSESETLGDTKFSNF